MNHRPTETGFGVTGLYHGDEGLDRLLASWRRKMLGVEVFSD